MRTNAAGLGCTGAKTNLQQIVNTTTLPMRSIVLSFLLSQVIYPANAQAQSRVASASVVESLFDASGSLPRAWGSSWPSIGGSSETTLDWTPTDLSFPSSFTPLLDYSALACHLKTVTRGKAAYSGRDHCTAAERDKATIRVRRRE